MKLFSIFDSAKKRLLQMNKLNQTGKLAKLTPTLQLKQIFNGFNDMISDTIKLKNIKTEKNRKLNFKRKKGIR